MAEPSIRERVLGDREVVELLGEEWRVLAELLASLPEEGWRRPALPGWTVHDVVAHLVGGEQMMAGAAMPEVPPAAEGGPHVKNDIGKVNERWVVTLREEPPADLVAAFRAVTAERLLALSAMRAEDFDKPSWTPVGNATYGRYLEIRIFDFWMHEQDIRQAVGRPGHESGPVAELALLEVVRTLGYLVGKKAAFPEGSSVQITLTGPIRRTLRLSVEDRARLVDELPGVPDVMLVLSSSLFLRLAGGRVQASQAAAEIEQSGDPELARRLVENLAYTI